MKRPLEVLTEVVCPACDGTGFQKAKQPTQPGRKIYPAKCEECLGRGEQAGFVAERTNEAAHRGAYGVIVVDDGD